MKEYNVSFKLEGDKQLYIESVMARSVKSAIEIIKKWYGKSVCYCRVI